MIGYLAAGFGIWYLLLQTGSGPWLAAFVAVVIVGGFAFMVKGHEDRPISMRALRRERRISRGPTHQNPWDVYFQGYHLRNPPGKR